ncbi:MAG: hypothetical protein K2H95_06335 [Bacteroidales bacterium]|nr:hypothetical protein [Bacteroidales bacterium]
MKALIIIAVCIACAFALHITEKFYNMKQRKVRIPIEDEENLREALRRYRDLDE